jgi:RES domain-containing protein
MRGPLPKMVGGGRVHDRTILDALENIDPEALEREVWRVTRRGRDPVRGAVANGRWNAIGEFEVLYTSADPEGALAEVGYRLSLEPVWPSKLKHQLHRLSIQTERALRIETLDQLQALGVDTTKFQNFDYEATQAIAAAAHFLEFDALIVPSARFPTTNTVLFLDRLRSTPEIVGTADVDWAAWRVRARR